MEGILTYEKPVNMAGPASARASAEAEGEFTDGDFQAIAAMVRAHAGIVLSANKRELVFGRLARRLRVLGLRSFTDYRDLLEGPEGKAEHVEMINAITTNLTSFFREPHHFDFLAGSVLPPLLREAPRGRLRIWSAACSSGEEPYSIAMVMQKALPDKNHHNARILATDIDTNILEFARHGTYPAERTTSIPSEYARCRVKHSADTVAMPDDLKRLITFNQLNLQDAWPMSGPFDVVFCRNVVIYFDKDTQRVLFDRIADIMSPQGYLFIGHSETLFRVSERFESLGRTIYRKVK
jgi:chemotaxis protein methyltransferase CheR